MLNTSQLKNLYSNTLADLKLLFGRQSQTVYCIEQDTWYTYEENASDFTANNKEIIETVNGGNTRWIGRTGKYNITYPANNIIIQNGHGFDNDFIYNNGTTWIKAIADNDETTATHFAIRITDNIFRISSNGEADISGILDDIGGAITIGEYYTLSQNVAGKISKIIPDIGLVQFVLKSNNINNGTVAISSPYNASIDLNLLVKTGNYTMTNNDDIIECDGTFTITTHPSALAVKKQYMIKNIGTGIITIDGNEDELIDNNTSTLLSPNDSTIIIPDGTNWILIVPNIIRSSDVIYDNSTSELIATNIQDAIDEIDLGLYDLKETGFVSWSDSGDYYSLTGSTFNLLRGGTGRILSHAVTWVGGQSVALTANACNYIYIDDTGAIRSNITDGSDTYINNIVLFEALYDGTNIFVVKENHPFSIAGEVSLNLHLTAGCLIVSSTLDQNIGADITRVTTGTGLVTTDREIKIVGEALESDHGLYTIIPDSAGVGIEIQWFYTNTAGQWTRYADQSQAPIVWNNAGTITALGSGKYANSRIYVSKSDLNSDDPIYVGVIGMVEHGNASQAQTNINNGVVATATNELFRMELCQLGFCTVQNNASGGYIYLLTIQKKTPSSVFSTGTGSSIASGVNTNTVNFDKILSAADSTVQAALEKLDEINVTPYPITGLKTFDKEKFAMKGTSTGINTISVANTSATNYTNTIPDKSGIFAMTNDINSYTTTATAGGTTTLTVLSNAIQRFTGTLAQNCDMPVVTTLPNLGWYRDIVNDSTGIITIRSSGGQTILSLPAGNSARITCILLTGTTEASWRYTLYASNSVNTLPLSQQLSIQSIPTGIQEGGITDFIANGLTLVNSVTNGNFASDTTGWLTNGTPLSASNNILTSLADTTNDRTYQTIKPVENEYWFFYVSQKAATSLASIAVTDDVNFTYILDTNTGSGAYEELYKKQQFTGTIAATSNFEITRDSRSSGWDNIYINGNAGVFAINMTALGIESYTEAQMLDLVRGGYFEGMENSKNNVVKCVGKNLFDMNDSIIKDFTFNADGSLGGVANTFYQKRYIPIKPSTTYTVSEANSNIFRIALYGSGLNFTQRKNSTGTSYSFTTEADEVYLRLSGSVYNDLDSFQLEENTTATTYELYKQSLFETECELRSLPNLTRDTIDGNGSHIQKIAEYALESADISSLVTSGSLVDYVAILKKSDAKSYNNTSGTLATAQLNNIKGFRPIVYTGALSDIGGFFNVSTGLTLGLVVAKGTYADVAAARTALIGTKVQYELLTQITTNLVTEGRANGIVKSFTNGTIYQDCAYNKSHLSVASAITVANPLREITQVTYISSITNEVVNIDIKTLTLSTDGVTITGLPIAAETYEIKGFLKYNISALLIGKLPTNQLAVIGSINDLLSKNSNQINKINDNLYKLTKTSSEDSSTADLVSVDVSTFSKVTGANLQLLLESIDDKFVATDKLTTQGDILYRDGSGYARLGAGTAGQILESGGAGANPNWADVNVLERLAEYIVATGETVTAQKVVELINGGVKDYAATVSSTITPATAAVFESASTGYTSVAMLTSTKAIVTYQDVDNSNYGTSCILDISGSTITPGTPAVFESASTTYISVAMLISTQAIVTYQDTDNSGYGTVCILDISGSTITPGTPAVFESASILYNSVAMLTSTKAIGTYRDDGNSSYGTSCILDIPLYIPSNFIGISKETKTSNEIAKIAYGEEIGGFTGLTQGTLYYIADDGTLSISVGSTHINPVAVAKDNTTIVWFGAGKVEIA